ncbi:MAG: hypothetical protein EZS28_003217 [Streblomastix strix]|uniref:Uncharacterized protein n=1 Tax=Streblomastix strix TaxID=222440 RepID=A0A5J4X212_9EUKA|nr:MAG: hypothetical protein EZS28_003217 [Streblomastix strix]
MFKFLYLCPQLKSVSKYPYLSGNFFKVDEKSALISDKKIASGPSYLTPTNTVSSTTIIARKEIQIIGQVQPEARFASGLGGGHVKKRGELSVIGTTDTAHQND